MDTEYDDLEHFETHRERKINVKGKDFVLRVSDPYGLWTIHNSKGGVPPKELEGSFTDSHMAETAIERYMGDYEFPNPDLPNVENTRKKVLKPKDPEYIKA